MEEITLEKTKELQEFVNDMKNLSKDLELKINGKYYKVNGNLNEIECDTYSIRLNFDIYFRR